MIEHKGYTGVVEYDPTIERLTGHVVDLKDTIYFEGRSVDEVRESMTRAVDQYLEVCEEKGIEPDRPFTGELRIRMDSELHRNASVAAAAERVSLNTWVQHALRRAIESGFQPTTSPEHTQRRTRQRT